jgi:hypothetical protein
MDMSFGVDTLLTIIAGIFAIIGVWTQLSNRLAILETKLEYGDEKFGEIMMHLRRIEDKLDNKADR